MSSSEMCHVNSRGRLCHRVLPLIFSPRVLSFALIPSGSEERTELTERLERSGGEGKSGGEGEGEESCRSVV